jgi:iron(III) transport system substrate-binding protein
MRHATFTNFAKWSAVFGLVALALPLFRASGLLHSLLGPKEAKAATALSEVAALTEEQLIDGSRQEKALVWYSALPEPVVREVLKKFEARYPWIKTDYIRVGGPMVIQRLMAEKERGVENVDIFSSGEAESYPELRRRGYTARLINLPNLSNLCDWAVDKEGHYVFAQASKLPMVYNTRLISDGEMPDSLAELADPKWKGKLASLDPGSSGAGLNFYRFIAAQPSLGFDWMRKLRANEVLLVGQIGPMTETVASGLRPIGVGQWDASEIFPAQKKGAPVKIKYPKEGYLLQLYPTAINSRAPHPHAARLFVNWCLSSEAQTYLDREGYSHNMAKGSCERLIAEGGWTLDIETITPSQTNEFKQKASLALRGR